TGPQQAGAGDRRGGAGGELEHRRALLTDPRARVAVTPRGQFTRLVGVRLRVRRGNGGSLLGLPSARTPTLPLPILIVKLDQVIIHGGHRRIARARHAPQKRVTRR
ncbi:MAG: hypothetical protein M3P94_01730, partial [Chloroflexota bacterium]|nr:hypothetical protein [Chloroflexota bacterium]